MSNFSVKVQKATIVEHPNANQLELCNVADYQAIVRKNHFKNGELIVYIPEQSLVPVSILREMGLEGKLAGKNGNRVKAIKLRGVLSQGLIYPCKPEWQEGQDVTEILGITKWEPPIPAHLAGEVYNAGSDKTIKYDIENFKNYPNIFQENEQVVFTEKLHGTFCCMALLPKKFQHPEYGQFFVTSKGLSSRGLALKTNSDGNKNNLYVRVAKHYHMDNRINFAFGNVIKNEIDPRPVYVIGELFGAGVQDLAYGASSVQDESVGFRVFDIYVGMPGKGRYLQDNELEPACKRLGLNRVPVLYRGPFSKQKMLEYTDGLETISGKSIHIREGIIIRPVIERTDPEIGRAQLKSVSADYLTRKGNTTEHQ